MLVLIVMLVLVLIPQLTLRCSCNRTTEHFTPITTTATAVVVENPESVAVVKVLALAGATFMRLRIS